jgi:tetratricopeptide (TPR) repeat protein
MERPMEGQWSKLLPQLSLLLGLAAPLAAGELKVGAQAPEFSLPDLEGKEHTLAEMQGEPVLLLFGEIYNKNSLAALDELTDDPRESSPPGPRPRCLFILGSQDPTEKLKRDWQDLKKDGKVLLLHDRRRTVFEGFGVKVLPTVMVLDGRRRLVLTVSGYPLNFSDVVSDGILYALGKIDRGRLDLALHPESPAGVDETQLKALRTARMAAALARRKLLELAVARFEEARSLDPQLLEARLGLADVQLQLGRIQESQTLYEEVLTKAPTSVAAHLGLAKIEIKRDQLDHAEKRLKEQAALHPLQAELHYLLGEAYEKRGKKEEALSAYKRASSILLERSVER